MAKKLKRPSKKKPVERKEQKGRLLASDRAMLQKINSLLADARSDLNALLNRLDTQTYSEDDIPF